MAHRKTLYDLKEDEGEVVVIHKTSFGIRSADGQSMLFPVNLPRKFQKSGIKVKFTAQTRQTGLTELWVGESVFLKRIEQL